MSQSLHQASSIAGQACAGVSAAYLTRVDAAAGADAAVVWADAAVGGRPYGWYPQP